MRWTDELTLSLTELAKTLGVNLTTLANWRLRDPENFPRPASGAGRSARYRLQEVLDWAAENGREVTPKLVEVLWLATLASTSAGEGDSTGVGWQLRCLTALIAKHERVIDRRRPDRICDVEQRRAVEGLVKEALQEAAADGRTASYVLDKVLDAASDRLGRGDLTSGREAITVALTLLAKGRETVGAPPPTGIYDPAIGVGTLAFKAAEQLGPDALISGVETNVDVHRIAKLRGGIRGLRIDLGSRPADALEAANQPSGHRADIVVADLPVGHGGIVDHRWLIHVLDHLDVDGWGVVIVPESVLGDPATPELSPRIHTVVRLPRIWQGSARARAEVVLVLGPESGQDIVLVDAADWSGGRDGRRRRGTTRASGQRDDGTEPEDLSGRVIDAAINPGAQRISRLDLEGTDDVWGLVATSPVGADLSRSIEDLEALLDELRRAATTSGLGTPDLASVARALETVADRLRHIDQ